MTRAVNIVNGIYSSQYFREQVGRSGRSGVFKRSNKYITRIMRTLKRAETYRGIANRTAIAPLRSVRKACYDYLDGWAIRNGDAPTGRDETHARRVLAALDARISTLANMTHGTPGADLKTPNIARINNKVAQLAAFDTMEETFFDDTHKQIDRMTYAFRSIDMRHYRYERATVDHVPHALVTQWMQDAATTLGVTAWCDTIWKWKVEDGWSPMRAANIGKWHGGVQYLDETERANFKVTINFGLVRDAAGHTEHTGNMQSMTGMGRGWGIYVIDLFDNLYIGSHERDRFHHSSFLSGNPVKAAGEINIQGGVVVGLTNKTGHYKAGKEELFAALRVLNAKGVVMSNLAVCDPFRAGGSWYRGNQVLAAEGDVTTLGQSTMQRPAGAAA